MNNARYRAVSWWITWPDLDWPSPDNHDRIRQRADQMQAAHANTAIIFGTHFRWDFMPYWTMLHDYMATVAEELKQRGIGLFDHHSGTLAHRYDDLDGWRRVKMHSGPHLPFCPDRASAAGWQFNGSHLNDWRMIDLQTGLPVWHERYTAEEFCFANPEFRAAYLEYLKLLVSTTGISGLMSDDFIYFNLYRGCGCRCCREIFRERFGYSLPEYGEPGFWGNWDNPDWRAYIDMRYENNGSMLEAIRTVLPGPDFPLLSCCSGSSGAFCNNVGQDIRQFMRGCNIVHLEMCGNTPGWQKDPEIACVTIGHRIVAAQHHCAVAEEGGHSAIGQGYGFTAATAGVIWALNKFLGSSCWFSTLKGRLGLPDRILSSLPDDATPVGRFFRFEAEHPELFSGQPQAETGVFFSYETRNHTFFGNLEDGHPGYFSEAVSVLSENGIPLKVTCRIPETAEQFSRLVLPGAAKLLPEEIANLRRYLQGGGIVLAVGPCNFPGVEMDWPMTNRSKDFTNPRFPLEEQAVVCGGERRWTMVTENFFHHPGRIGEAPDLPERCRPRLHPLPLEMDYCRGYHVSLHYDRERRSYTVHLLAADFDTEINRELDAMRYHRSRVHYITGATPRNTDTLVRLKTDLEGEVFTPLSEERTTMRRQNEVLEIQLPPQCAYVIIRLPEKPLNNTD